MKKTSRPQYRRIGRMMEMLRDGTRTGRYPNASDFTPEFDVVRRTILRDIDYLRDDLRAPIAYDASKRGYYLSDVTWRLPAVELSRNEVFAFSVAAKLVQAYKGTPLEMDLASTFEKIAESLEGKVTIDLEAMTDRITVLGEDYARIDPETWRTVAHCVDAEVSMWMRYQRFDGVIKAYAVDPYHMIAYHGDWYALAGQPDRNRLVTYALSRIREARGNGERFERDPRLNIEEHIRSSFGINRGDEVFKVRLLFSRHVAAYIRSRVWHPAQVIRERRNGDLELRFETAGWKELVRWVLSWQPDCRVLVPAKLKRRIDEKMREALNER